MSRVIPLARVARGIAGGSIAVQPGPRREVTRLADLSLSDVEPVRPA